MVNDPKKRQPIFRGQPDWFSIIVFSFGLILFGLGLGWAWGPLGFIGTGLVLMCITLFGGGPRE